MREFVRQQRLELRRGQQSEQSSVDDNNPSAATDGEHVLDWQLRQ
jgi:hypothetical protein